MSQFKVLKIKLYQPHAHYRIPFTYRRKHTYPIPPYSTVIGLLCNILGITNYEKKEEPCSNQDCDCDYHKLKDIKISIAGTFESKTTEYTWIRNLSKESHNSRFGSEESRSVSGHVEHPGGQIPNLIDILNDVYLWIYMYHEDKDFLDKIRDSFENPSKRIYPLHLGRAEDWFLINEIKYVDVEVGDVGGNFGRFFWIPRELYVCPESEFKKEFKFEKVGGILYKVPTFYKLINGLRNFSYVEAKLNDGEISLVNLDMELYFDQEEKLPIFLAKL
ncbi:MAG: type I-B CRISPR-associated protein Cas5b, partial [Candidatus Calescibacterium sp.]|nr:type I-B CRISPR-associated protein Cas5b [Candidatus Calescibacterium sp.]